MFVLKTNHESFCHESLELYGIWCTWLGCMKQYSVALVYTWTVYLLTLWKLLTLYTGMYLMKTMLLEVANCIGIRSSCFLMPLSPVVIWLVPCRCHLVCRRNQFLSPCHLFYSYINDIVLSMHEQRFLLMMWSIFIQSNEDHEALQVDFDSVSFWWSQWIKLCMKYPLQTNTFLYI